MPDQARQSQPARRPAILVVLTYGMNLRDVALNRALWSYLTDRYEVDVWSPVTFDNPSALHISRTLGFPPGPSWTPAGFAARLRSRALTMVQQMRMCDFYFFAGLGHILNWAYALAYNMPAERKKWWHFSQFLYYTPWGETIRRAAVRFISRHPLRRAARERGYRFVFVTHPREDNNQVASIVAAALGIPVVMAPLGLDNLTHGGTPIIEPDLALLWGDEQVHEYRAYLMPFNAALRKTTVVPVGSLVHDNYVAAPDLLTEFLAAHALDASDDVILFAAHVDRYYPNQLEQAGWIVEFIRERGLRTKLIVRVRPGLDEEMWARFRANHPDIVRLQVPGGVAYDKSGHRHGFSLDEERYNVAMFATTLRRAKLLVAAALSTTYTDAQLFRTPAVALLCDAPSAETLFTRTRFHQQFTGDYPYYADYNIAHNRAELRAFLEKLYAPGGREALLSTHIFEKQAIDRTGQAGRRAVDAIERMFPTPVAVAEPCAGQVVA